MQNIEVGVKRAAIAFLREKGVPEAQAVARVTAKLPQACDQLTAAMQAQNTRSIAETNLFQAFAALKIWVLANV